MPEVETQEPRLKNVTIRVGKSIFRCTCGCNVFHKPDSNDANLYQCNYCGKQYCGESEE